MNFFVLFISYVFNLNNSRLPVKVIILLLLRIYYQRDIFNSFL